MSARPLLPRGSYADPAGKESEMATTGCFLFCTTSNRMPLGSVAS